jgi:hypothetical protein
MIIKEKRNYAEINDNDFVVISSRESSANEQPILELWGSSVHVPVPDTTAPSNVSNMTAVGGFRQATLHWTDPGEPDFVGVHIYNGSTLVADIAKGVNSAAITSLANGKVYTFTMKSYDAAGNESSGVNVKVKVVPANGHSSNQ